MAAMTDSEILRLAQEAVPEHIRPLGRIVKRHDVAGAGLALAAVGEKASKEDELVADLAKRVGAKLGKAEPDSADVEFPEQTALGLRTTVVHVRNGKVARVLKRG
jgi:hypothetical protein